VQVTETQAAQLQLDRAAEDYRRLHSERQQLIRQWDEAATAMRRRDAAIGAAGAAFAERRLALRRRKGELDARARLLEGEVAANRELEARIAHYEKEVVSCAAMGYLHGLLGPCFAVPPVASGGGVPVQLRFSAPHTAIAARMPRGGGRARRRLARRDSRGGEVRLLRRSGYQEVPHCVRWRVPVIRL
jgi:hypothetical protein